MAMEREGSSRRLLTNRRLLGLVAAALLLALLTLFVADNFVLVEIRLVNLRIEARLAWALLVPTAAGLAIGYLAGRYRR
jgi:uncharacterized integral membrane protein